MTSPADRTSYQNSTVDAPDVVTADERSSPKKMPRRWKKLLVALPLASLLLFVVVDSLTAKRVASGFSTFLDWISAHLLAGLFAFVGVYFLAPVAFVPGSILTLGGGFVIGNAMGLGPGVAAATGAAFLGAGSGAIAGFLLGRYLLRDWVKRRLVERHPSIKALDEGEFGDACFPSSSNFAPVHSTSLARLCTTNSKQRCSRKASESSSSCVSPPSYLSTPSITSEG